MVFTDYTKQQILLNYEDSASPSISRRLMKEGIVASRGECCKVFEVLQRDRNYVLRASEVCEPFPHIPASLSVAK